MGVDCIDVPQDADKWWVVVHRVTKLWVPLNVGISRLAEALISFWLILLHGIKKVKVSP